MLSNSKHRQCWLHVASKTCFSCRACMHMPECKCTYARCQLYPRHAHAKQRAVCPAQVLYTCMHIYGVVCLTPFTCAYVPVHGSGICMQVLNDNQGSGSCMEPSQQCFPHACIKPSIMGNCQSMPAQRTLSLQQMSHAMTSALSWPANLPSQIHHNGIIKGKFVCLHI